MKKTIQTLSAISGFLGMGWVFTALILGVQEYALLGCYFVLSCGLLIPRWRLESSDRVRTRGVCRLGARHGTNRGDCVVGWRKPQTL